MTQAALELEESLVSLQELLAEKEMELSSCKQTLAERQKQKEEVELDLRTSRLYRDCFRYCCIICDLLLWISW